MQIDKAFLEKEIESLTQQRAQAHVVMCQADGAIASYRALIDHLDREEAPKEPVEE